MRDLSTNTTTLVSVGAAECQAEGCGNGAFDAGFAPDGLTPDGNEAFFVTKEQPPRPTKTPPPTSTCAT